MDIQKLLEMASQGQSPVSHPQPHPLEPNQQPRNMETGNQILDLIMQVTGGQRGHGSDGDMMEVGNTMDGMSEAAILAQMTPGGKGPPPTMGMEEYTPVPGQPMGWDYDTLATALDEFGEDIETFSPEEQEMLMSQLEAAGAKTNEEAAQLFGEFLDGDGDPHNANPNAKPLPMEDGEDGYWDAKNMGNGKGNSFLMDKGQQRMADPVGNGAMIEELMKLIGPAGGR